MGSFSAERIVGGPALSTGPPPHGPLCDGTACAGHISAPVALSVLVVFIVISGCLFCCAVAYRQSQSVTVSRKILSALCNVL